MAICAIRAGPAGLACAATLKRAGHAVVVLERGDVGAAWATRYDCLHLHTARWHSALPGCRIPRSFAPGLHFVGYRVTLGGMLRMVGAQARQSAHALT